jgi:GPH family glycoside/pentoside/hexuronide:cation symporter
MLGDIADEHELHHGKRQEGIYFSTFSFAAKCTSGIGNLIAGIALDIIGLSIYKSSVGVPDEVITRFGLVYGLVALIAIAALWVFRPYHLDKKRHDDIMRELQDTVWAKGAKEPQQ